MKSDTGYLVLLVVFFVVFLWTAIDEIVRHAQPTRIVISLTGVVVLGAVAIYRLLKMRKPLN